MFSYLKVGQHAVFSLDAEFVKRIEFFLQRTDTRATSFWFKIAALDNSGVWIEKPRFKGYDKDHKPKDFILNIYIPSHFIITVVLFPEEEITNMRVSDGTEIGFLANV